MKLLEKIIDWWLTRKTGYNKLDRDFIKWKDSTINIRAPTVHGKFGYFCKFKYIIVVDSNKFFDHSEPFGWIPVPSFKEFRYDMKNSFDDCAMWIFERGIWQDNIFHITTFGDCDVVFVATNNDFDAYLIAMRYS
jgi:hypothetical protein